MFLVTDACTAMTTHHSNLFLNNKISLRGAMGLVVQNSYYNRFHEFSIRPLSYLHIPSGKLWHTTCGWGRDLLFLLSLSQVVPTVHLPGWMD